MNDNRKKMYDILPAGMEAEGSRLREGDGEKDERVDKMEELYDEEEMIEGVESDLEVTGLDYDEGNKRKKRKKRRSRGGIVSNFGVFKNIGFLGKFFRVRSMPRFAVRLGLFVVIVGGSFLAAYKFLPRATVVIVMKDYVVDVEERVLVGINVPRAGFEGGGLVLPGEILTARKNIELSFPASGKSEVEDKASGKIVIYNAFSSNSQVLVGKTRFETTDGKVFRLTKSVTVPGAKIVDGSIEPSSVEVEVAADEPGGKYNIGPVALWSIPGFKGTPRYDGFYASSLWPMSGGFVGVRSVETDEDVAAAKDSIEDTLMNSLKEEMAVLIKPSYDVLEGTTDFQLVSREVHPPGPGEDFFRVFAEAELRQLVFERPFLDKELIAKAESSLDEEIGFKATDYSFSISELETDWDKGSVSFDVSGEVVFNMEVNRGLLAAQILNMDASGVKKQVFALPGLERAHVSMWPFWVRRVPNDVGRVEVVVE